MKIIMKQNIIKPYANQYYTQYKYNQTYGTISVRITAEHSGTTFETIHKILNNMKEGLELKSFWFNIRFQNGEFWLPINFGSANILLFQYYYY